NMLQRSALISWENCAVKQAAHFFKVSVFQFLAKGILEILSHQNHSPTWAAQGFVGRSCNNMAMRKRIANNSFCDQSRGMGNICKKNSTYFIGNFPETFVIYFP